MENLSFIVTKQLSNTSDKKVAKMNDNWSLRICVVSFPDSVGIILKLHCQQVDLPVYTPISLFPAALIPTTAMAQG